MAQIATLPPEVEQCIENCDDCHRICLESVAHCLEMGGAHAETHHIRMLLDCSDICRTASQFMVRGSELHGRICGVCAEVCDACGQECERFSDDLMRICAEVCRRCAESCKQMARSG